MRRNPVDGAAPESNRPSVGAVSGLTPQRLPQWNALGVAQDPSMRAYANWRRPAGLPRTCSRRPLHVTIGASSCLRPLSLGVRTNSVTSRRFSPRSRRARACSFFPVRQRPIETVTCRNGCCGAADLMAAAIRKQRRATNHRSGRALRRRSATTWRRGRARSRRPARAPRCPVPYRPVESCQPRAPCLAPPRLAEPQGQTRR